MRMPNLLLVKLSIVTLLVVMLWITGCDSKAGAQASKAKSAPAACPMATAEKACCPAMKDDATCCQETTCSDEKKATCSAETTCPIMGAAAEDPANPTVENAVSAGEQTTCPVMGSAINKDIFTEYKGKKVYFCCAGCKPEFEKNPEKYLGKLPQFK